MLPLTEKFEALIIYPHKLLIFKFHFKSPFIHQIPDVI